MPALSNGNTCWGNRKTFNLSSEYISESFLFDLGNVNEDIPTVATPRQNFISSNSYYGYHMIPSPPIEEKMSVDDCELSTVDSDNARSISRKRPNNGVESDFVKRLRQGSQVPCPSQLPFDSRKPMYNSHSLI